MKINIIFLLFIIEQKYYSLFIQTKIKAIENFVFERCTSLNEITIPSFVKEIGYLAFGYCTSR